ncbi:DUF3616 domain-containing protein [Notoacmeibacter marinus]|uniref:DUF3616 domain-containing protein n=1 Tax=Notoacmeibacter marinus TaxID=1876515 RepID=UPI000DF2BDDB|nr:DUF3616 domain-containing protein [Notoacmeibacter marinus]
MIDKPTTSAEDDTPHRDDPAEKPATGRALPLSGPPDERLPLIFQNQDRLAHIDDPIHRDVSALAVSGRTLFATCDETASIERLIFDADKGAFTDHVSFPLGSIFDLPDGIDGEMDIEGLEIADGWLWICGSHSLKRDGPDGKGLAGLDDIDWDPNRAFLGRLPLLDRGDGVFEPVALVEPVGGERREAAALKMNDKGGPMRRRLEGDPLLGPFMSLPCKENGFDIEGFAAHGETVWIGLRGPVIGSHAIIIELQLKEKKSKARRLKPQKIDGRRYRLYGIDLDGQAIRDLRFREGVLYLLSGATTDLEAMQAVYRIEQWPPETDIVPAHKVERVLDLPVLRGSDHAEGLCFFRRQEGWDMLIAYDSPDDDRIDDDNCMVEVDVYPMPSAGK